MYKIRRKKNNLNMGCTESNKKNLEIGCTESKKKNSRNWVYEMGI
jgi:hypothetical protein